MSKTDLIPIAEILLRHPIPKGAEIELAMSTNNDSGLRKDELGVQKIDADGLDIYNNLTQKFEIPALRAFIERSIRHQAGKDLDRARQEFGHQGFQLKAAVLGSMACKAYLELEDYTMAEAEVEIALMHDRRARHLVEESTSYVHREELKQNEADALAVRANFPDLADPLHPKIELNDFSSPDTMQKILKSHLALRTEIHHWGHLVLMKKLHAESERYLGKSNSNYVVMSDKHPPPKLRRRSTRASDFGAVDHRY